MIYFWNLKLKLTIHQNIAIYCNIKKIEIFESINLFFKIFKCENKFCVKHKKLQNEIEIIGCELLIKFNFKFFYFVLNKFKGEFLYETLG